MADPSPEATTLVTEQARRAADDEAADAALAASGDAHAFERLYRAHVGRIHSLARRMLDRDEVDEATQDVFVRAWQKLGTYRGEAGFGTWLYRVAVNVMLSRRRSRGIDRARFTKGEALAEMAGPSDSLDAGLDFEQALTQLPPGARQVFVLHDVTGYTHEEIAGMLGVAIGTSKSQLHHARMALRKHI